MENQEVIYEICTKDSTSNHAAGILQNCANLFSNHELVDCTIVCKDGQLQGHKVILAASCKYMHELLTTTTSFPTPCSHPMIFLRRWNVEDLKTVLQYMYTGQATIRQTKLATILKICDELEYLPLAKAVVKATSSKSRSSSSKPTSTPRPNLVISQSGGDDLNRPKKSKAANKTVGSQAQIQESSKVGVVADHQNHESSSSTNSASATCSVSPVNIVVKTETIIKSEIESAEEDDEEDFFNETQPVSGKMVGNNGQNGHKRSRQVEDEEPAKRRIVSSSTNGTSFKQNGMLNGNTKIKLEFDVEDNGESGEDENEVERINLMEDLLEINNQNDAEESQSHCPWCNETFTNVGVLQRHLRTHVNKCRPYSCEHCHTSFARSAHLKRHLRTHTGEKPYVCSVCNRAFARQDKLKGHMERHLLQQPNNGNENLLSSNNSNDAMMTITSFNSQAIGNPIKVLIPNKKVGRPPSTKISSSTSEATSSLLQIGNNTMNGNNNNRFLEIGSTTSNGLSISLASSSNYSVNGREKSQFSGGGGLLITPASRPSSAYIQSLTSRGTNGSSGTSKANKHVLNYVL